nr:MAG: hypothetical protein [uncultured archaeon]
MGKLKRIKERFAKLEKNVNLMSIKLQEFESYSDELSKYKEKFNLIYDLIAVEEEQISEADMIKQQEESLTQMKDIVKAAIIEMANKKENQEALHNFVTQFQATATGQAGGLPFDVTQLQDKDGNWDIVKAGLMWWNSRQKGDMPKLGSSSSGKTTGY